MTSTRDESRLRARLIKGGGRRCRRLRGLSSHKNGQRGRKGVACSSSALAGPRGLVRPRLEACFQIHGTAWGRFLHPLPDAGDMIFNRGTETGLNFGVLPYYGNGETGRRREWAETGRVRRIT